MFLILHVIQYLTRANKDYYLQAFRRNKRNIRLMIKISLQTYVYILKFMPPVCVNEQ